MVCAVIFDLDGTVLDNEREWEGAFRRVAKKFSITNPPAGRVGFQFTNSPNNWMHEPGIGIFNNWRKYVDFEEAQKLTMETVKEYRGGGVRDGLIQVVEKVKERGWWTGLCTGGNWNVVERELEQLGLYLAFDVTTTGEEVLLQKPDPEIYLLTAQKLGAEPEECVVIEDAVAGVRAGVEAGCQVIGLESDYAPKDRLLAAGAKWTVGRLEEIQKIDELWDRFGG